MTAGSVPEAASGCRLLVDARGIESAGIGRYIREVVAGLIADRRFERIVLLGDTATLERFAANHAHGARIDFLAYPGEYYSPATQAAWLRLGREYAREADVVFFPHYDAPLSDWRVPAVVTVHDLTQFMMPTGFRWWRRAAGSVLLARVVERAARVITGSFAARDDLVRRFPGIAAKIEVVYHGVGPTFRRQPGADRNGTGGEIRPLRPFLLCVGNRKTHKNLEVAVETLAMLLPDRPDLKLVIVGKRFPEWKGVLRRAEELSVAAAIVDLEHADDATLARLYSDCEAFLFPSLYEGFGLPVLEAMGCGAPVIASDRASIPEVVGDAGIVVDPTQASRFAESVRRLWADAELREELVSRGYRRARQFDWDQAARATADILLQTART